MKKILPILLVVALLLTVPLFGKHADASGSTNSDITVKLSTYLGNQTSVNLTVTGNYKVKTEERILNGDYVLKIDSGKLILYKNGTRVRDYDTSFTVQPEAYNTRNILSINGRKYLGTVRFEVEDGKYIRPYNTLPVEDYLKGVVSQEMSPSWGNDGGMDALKSQAIAARTYAQGVNPIDDGETDQVYTGYYWYDNTNMAVEATQGLVLKYNGQIIGGNALYSSSNGGKTLSKVNSWGEQAWNYVPYLQVKEDPYDLRSSGLGNNNVNWQFSLVKNQIDTKELDLTDPNKWWNEKKEINSDAAILKNIKSWLQSNGYVDKKYEIKMISIPEFSFETNVSSDKPINGHMKINYWLRDTTTDRYEMENGKIKTFSKTIDSLAYTFRRMIGSSYMKSPFIKSVEEDSTKFTVNGGGWGHGIGMSQYGAYQMSTEGKTFQEILGFYYPGTTLADVLGPTVSNLTVSVNSDHTVTLNYQLDEESTTSITLDNPAKNILVKKVQPKGMAQVTWDASSLPSGNYTFTIRTSDASGNSSLRTGSFALFRSSVKLTLTAPKTYLYNEPNGKGNTGEYLTPQTVYADLHEGNWYRIQTWIGLKWIEIKSEPEQPKIKLTLTASKTYLYDAPNIDSKTDQYLSPQTVYADMQEGNWYRVKTWLGLKWVEVPSKTESKTISLNMTLLDRTKLYTNPSTAEAPITSIAPQTVKAIEQKGDWFKIKTWIGDKWIKPERYCVPVSKKLTLTQRTYFYNEPTKSVKAVSSLSPQTVTVIAEIPNTGWYQINTWIGPKWIQL